MKKKLLILLAVAALIATVIAAPAGASREYSLRGHQDLDFNMGVVFGVGAAPNVSYVGMLQLSGDTYDIVYFSEAPPEPYGEWVYFEEIVRIYEAGLVTAEFGEIKSDIPDVPPVITGITKFEVFEDHDPVVELTDKGWGFPWGTAIASGNVTTTNSNADPHGVLSGVEVGDRVIWYGRYLDDTHMTFAGMYSFISKG